MTTNLSVLDYVVLLAYLAATLAIGFWVGRRISTGADFFLAGRRLPWWAVGMSLVATDIGGVDIIGVGGSAFRHGLAVANFEWIGCIPAMIVAAFVFAPYFWRTRIYTIPEFMERRYNPAVRSALAVCWLVFMACNLGIMLLASAKLTTVLLGWDPAVSIVLTAVLVGVYTTSGGLEAVVYTDVLQCTVMIAGCLLVVVLGLVEIGGIGQLQAEVQAIEQTQRAERAAQDPAAATERAPERTRLVLPLDTESPWPWPGILFGLALVLSPAYWIGNQAIIQRAFGARSEFEAKASYVWGALLKSVIPVIIAVPGLIAMVKFRDLPDQDRAIPQLVAALLPGGLRGMFVAAFLAALMSTVDSYLNSAATILTKDLYGRFVQPAASERHLLWFGRFATVVLVGWAIFFAFLSMRLQKGIYDIFQTMMAFFQGPALAILMAGLLWRRATGIAALVSFICGVLFSVTLFALNQPWVYEPLGLRPLFRVQEPYLYFSVWAFLTTLGLLVVLSLLTPPEPEEKVRHLVFSRSEEKKA